MKNPQKAQNTTKHSTYDNHKSQKTEPPDDLQSNMNAIGLQIIDLTQTELNSIDTQDLLKNYTTILQSLQEEVETYLSKGKCQQEQIENLFNKNYETISNYFFQCLQSFENVKAASVDLLKNCLNQLFEFIINYTQKTTKSNENLRTTSSNMLSKEETIVYLINTLSHAIKAYKKNTHILLKDIFAHSQSSIEELNQKKVIINNLFIQLMNKNTIKPLKDNLTQLGEKMDYFIQLNKNIENEANLVENHSNTFYEEAKKIFRNLKTIYNEKQEDMKIQIESNSSGSLMNNNVFVKQQPLKKIDNKRNQSVSPTQKRMINNANVNSRYVNTISPNKNNINNGDGNSLSNSTNNPQGMKELSRSTDHYSKGNKISKKTQQNNKQLNVSTSNSINNPSTHCDTSPNINPRTTQMLTELNEKNKELKQEIEKITDENMILKHNLTRLKNTYETHNSKSTFKSKSLNDFISSNNNSNQNITSSPTNEAHTLNNQTLDPNGQLLAINILSFINNMKELQNSICQRAPNVVDMKKDFEKQKKDLIQFATFIQSSASSAGDTSIKPKIQSKSQAIQVTQSITPQANPLNVSKESHSRQMREECSQLKKTCKDYESVIKNLGEQINDKNNEITKVTLDLQKALENKKGISNQAKIKELENKIASNKTENDQLKSQISSLEKKIKEYTEQMSNKEKQQSNDNKSSSQKSNIIIKENEELKGNIEELQNQQNKLKKNNEEYTNQIQQLKESNDLKIKTLQTEKDTCEQKYLILVNDISIKEKELNTLKQNQTEIEKEKKELNNKLTTLQGELTDLKKSNDKLRGDNEKLVNKLSQIESQSKTTQNDSSNQKTLMDKLKSEVIHYQNEINKIKDDSIKQNEKNQNIINDYKLKLMKKENEMNDNRKKQEIPTVQQTKEPSSGMSYKNELIETSKQLQSVKQIIKEKYTELSLALANPNEAFVNDNYDDDDDDEEDEKVFNKGFSISTPQQLTILMKRNHDAINSIDSTVMKVFELIKANLKLDDDEDNIEDDEDRLSVKADKLNMNIDLDMPLKASPKHKGSTPMNNDKIIIELKNEISILKNFFTECTNTIFETIKTTAPHMIDEESELSFNLVSGNNIPINILDSKKSPPFSPNQSANKKDLSQSAPIVFDQEYISAAVTKFKNFSSEITGQLKKLQLEKEELEREAHSNMIKSQAYKAALDDAISKMNMNSEDRKNIGMTNNKETIDKDQGRIFTMEDLDKQKDHNQLSDNRDDYRKVNSDLMLIQSDLLKKLEMKDDEIQRLQTSVNTLSKIKDGNSKDKTVNESKYQQVLGLYTKQQEINLENKKMYQSLVHNFSIFVHKTQTNAKMTIISLNQKKRTKSQDSKEKHKFSMDNDDIGEDDDMEQEYDPNELLKEKAKKSNKNNTHGQIKHFDHNVDYLGMLNNNDKEDVSNNSAINQEVRIQELFNENKNHEEQEELLITQLNAVKKELKETRELVNHITLENKRLNEELSHNVSVDNNDIIGPLRNAIEKLILEITLTTKIKEYLSIILRIVGYNDDQILVFYKTKDKKKGLKNLFK